MNRHQPEDEEAVLSEAGDRAVPKVLMVDDDEDARLLFASQLRQHKWTVLETASGADALEILDSSFDAVVLDEMMPVMNGMQTLEKIRSRADLDGIWVIMLTATTDWRVITSTLKHSPDAYLSKMETTPETLYVELATRLSGVSREGRYIGDHRRTIRSLRPVRAFLCHSRNDEARIGELYSRLERSFVKPWFADQNLLGGQDWKAEIRAALERSDVVIVCLSPQSVSTPGLLHQEISYALERAQEMPEGRIYIIPLLLQKCEIPSKLSTWHWIDYANENGWERLMRSLRRVQEDISREEKA